MKIIGPDALIFGVDDPDGCACYLTDYGLTPSSEGRFMGMDGTSVVIKHRDDTSLPKAMETANQLRKTVYGVADEATIAELILELERDREVTRLSDGSIETVDDMGFVLGFQVTVRKAISAQAETINAPGAAPQRPANVLAVDVNATIRPRTLSHVVYFVPDEPRATAFYTERLGFRVTDRLLNAGPFLRPAGTQDHHTLFMIQTPPHMKGIEHFTFHVGGPTELMQAGTRFVEKGYQSFWGPGRHKMGSNWFWYFNSPLGCHVEYDADMDLHDDSWLPREITMSADASQLFLFEQREKWSPGGPRPKTSDSSAPTAAVAH